MQDDLSESPEPFFLGCLLDWCRSLTHKHTQENVHKIQEKEGKSQHPLLILTIQDLLRLLHDNSPSAQMHRTKHIQAQYTKINMKSDL